MRVLIFLFFLVVSSLAVADELVLNIHGTSKHSGTNIQYNEYNPGLGITKYTGNKFITTGFYKNSINRTSVYYGVGMKKSIFSIVGGISTGYNHTFVPVLLPKMSIGVLDIYYIPKIDKNYIPEIVMFSTSWRIK